MTQHHALFILDLGASVQSPCIEQAAQWMDFDAHLWRDQFSGFFAYAGDYSDLKKNKDELALIYTPASSNPPAPTPSAKLEAWAQAHSIDSIPRIGGGGGDIFAQTLLVVAATQKQLGEPLDARISRICIFSDFYDPPPTASRFSALTYFRDVELVLCADAMSDPKYVGPWALAATSFFRSVQVVHVDEHLASKRAHDEATDLAQSIPNRKSPPSKMIRSSI